MRRKFTFAFILASLGLAQLIYAESPADRVPADALGYATWAGSDVLGPAYDNSHLKKLLDACNLPQLFAERMQEDLKKNEADADKLADTKLGQELIAAAIKAPTTLYFGPVDLTDPKHPQPHIAVFSKVGAAKAADLAAQANPSMTRNRKPGEPTAAASVVGDYLLITIGPDNNFAQRLSGPIPADNLAATPAFKDAMNHAVPPPPSNGPGSLRDLAPPATFVYVNAEAVLKLIDDAIQAKGDRREMMMWPKAQEILGLSNIHTIALAGKFDGPNWSDRLYVSLSAQRTGLTGFLDSKPITDETFKLIPKSATWAMVTRVDFARLLDDLRAGANQIDPANGARGMDMALQQFYAVTGVDLRKDVVNALSDTFVFYGTRDAAGSSFHGATLATKPKDAKTLDTSLAALEATVNAMIAQRNPDSKVQLKAQALPAPHENITAHILTLPNWSPAWAIAGDTLFVAATTPALQSAIENAAAKAPGATCILDNPTFTELRKHLESGPNKQIAGFSYVDLPAIAPEIYAPIAQGFAKKIAENPGEKNAFLLPPLDKITPHLTPTLTVYWSDADGFPANSIGPFPLANALNPKTFLFAVMSKQRAAKRVAPAPAPADPNMP